MTMTELKQLKKRLEKQMFDSAYGSSGMGRRVDDLIRELDRIDREIQDRS